MNLIDNLLNIGSTPGDDIQKIRLIRQVNGHNLFFTFVAISGGVIFKVLIPDTLWLQLLQILGTLGYMTNIAFNLFKKLGLAQKSTVIVFEIHVFFMVLLTNAWNSPVLLIIVLYPLLATLAEVSILAHLAVGMTEFAIFFSLHYFFNEWEKSIIRFSGISSQSSEVILVLILLYVPIMATVIIRIIFHENLRAREKQKEMLNEISLAKKQLEIYAERLKDESQRLQAEVNIAKKIQTMVLPLHREIDKIEDLEISLSMLPADEVGGDYYDVIKQNDIITIGIGDVTGHGLSSGIIMLMAQTAIKTLVETKVNNPKELISILNRVLYSNITRINENKNMSLLIINYIDKKYVVSGQHESIIICRENGDLQILDTMRLGFYVGMLPEIEGYLNNYEFELKKDDLMVLYSDGVTEAMDKHGRQFGLDMFCQLIKKYRNLPTKKIKFKIIENLYNYMGNTMLYDDIALVIIKQK